MKNLKNKQLISGVALVLLIFTAFGFVPETVDAGGGTPTINQRHYRWRNDDGSESTATWKAAENTAVTGQAKQENVRLRFEIDNTGTASLGNQDYNSSWYYSTNAGGDCSAGTWTLIPVSPTTEHWELVSSTNFADKDVTTNNGFSTHQNSTFIAGKMREEPVAGGNYNVTLATTDYSQVEGVFQATTNATDSQTYYIRATRAGTVLDNYVQCATITLAAGAAPADLSWDTGVADFEIWAGATANDPAVLTWDNGTLICSTSLTDDNTRQSTCGSINKSQKYRIQTVLENIGGTAASMNGAADPVDQKNVKTFWAGTSPTISAATDCGFNDLGADNGATTCNVAFSGNDVRVTNTGAGNVVIAATTGTEGFMYLLTTDSDVSLSDSSTFMNASIDTITEDSSRITIGQKRKPGLFIRGKVTIRGAYVKFR